MLYEKLTHAGYLESTGAIDALSGQTAGWALGVRVEADAVIAALTGASQGMGLGVFLDGPGGTELGHLFLFRASNNNLRLRFVSDVTTEADSAATIATQLQAGDFLHCIVHMYSDGSNHRDVALVRDRGGVFTLLASTSGSGDGGFATSSADLRLRIGATGTLLGGAVTMKDWTGRIDGFYLLDTSAAITSGERESFLWDDADCIAAVDFENDTAGVFEDVSGGGETFTAQGAEDTAWRTVAGGDWTAVPAGPVVHPVTSVDSAGGGDAAAATLVVVTNAEDAVEDWDFVPPVLTVLSGAGDDAAGVIDRASATLVIPTTAIDRIGSSSAIEATLLVTTAAVDRVGTKDIQPAAGQHATGAGDAADVKDRASATLVIPVTLVERIGATSASAPSFALVPTFIKIDRILVNGVEHQVKEQSVVLEDTDNFVVLSGLADGVTNELIQAGSGFARLVDKQGQEVPGQSWPTALEEMLGVPGSYYVSISRSVQIERRRPYVLEITFEAGAVRYWEVPLVCEVGE